MRSLVLFVAAAWMVAAQDAKSEKDKIEWGRYLTVEVGKCQECHTPKTAEGKLDETKWMKGAVLDFAPMQPVKGWHKTAPDLTPAGRLWERWGEAGLVKFMNTGRTPRGGQADPPMPTYQLKLADAEAMVAYLKSLK
jgi:mono/diheme cytochrome c family protein